MAYSSSTTRPTTPQDCVLYVFRKTDLRVTDNLALKKAVSFGLPVCVVVCLDIQEWNRRGQTTGVVSTGSLRRRFLLESVEDLNESLTCLRERFGRTGRARDAIETQQVSTSPASRVADAAENNDKNARKSGRGPLFASALSLSATVEKLLGLNTSAISLRYRIAHVVCTHEVGSFEEEEQQETTRVVARGVSASTGSPSSSGTYAQFHVVHDDTLVPRDILSNEVGCSLGEAGLKSSDRTFFKQYTQFRGAIEANAHRAVSHENKADRHTRFVPALEFREAYCTKMGSFVSTSEHSARGIFSADIAPKFWPWSSTPAGSKSSHAPSSEVVDPEFVTLAEVVCSGKATDDDLLKILGPDIWAWNSDKTSDLLLKFSVDSAGNHGGFHVAESTTVHTAETPTYRGGERAALKRLKYYLWDSNAVATYKETRNESVGDKYSTKFSMYLAAGNISPRTIVHELTLYENERSQNESTYWVVFELLWRDFLHFASAVYPRNKFYRLKGIFPRRNWTTSGKKPDWALDMSDNTQKVRLFECWKSGTTGFPYIDAQMRELRATGFMGNRGRQNVASFLIFNLKCDWRWGAEWFEHCLLDHDPASNYGNWQTIAGVGFQDRENRFNVVKQSRQYESKGSAMKKWIPELQPTADLLHKQVSSRGEASSTNDPRLMEVWHCPWNVHDKSLLPAVYANPILDPRKEFFDPGHRAEAGAGKDGGKGRALNRRVDGKEQDARNNKQNNVGKRHGGENDGKRWGRKN